MNIDLFLNQKISHLGSAYAEKEGSQSNVYHDF